ncbi:MAG: hypothetical protein GY903_31725 [Fuerstiella sp.]|nr:hypothetical protein [Fuerstiella sp.]MCP4859061.1 hypothetical protein [Fuerstiella sp.]
MADWLMTYNETAGMYHAAIITSIAGAFFVAFTVIIAWPKMVEDFGPAGGMMCAAFIVGTFWIMNHKLPGFGINPELIKDGDDNAQQFGLIAQSFHGASPWIDMGWAIGIGMWVCCFCETPREKRLDAAAESFPRLAAVIIGGIIGGAIVGLTGYTNAVLFPS